MSSDLTGDVPGATPLDPDDLAGLIPIWVSTRGELNAVEQDNIIAGQIWAARRRWTVESVADTQMMRRLHKQMFGEVWTWAGKWRRKDTNIGVDWHRISTEMHQLQGDLIAQASDPQRLAWPAPELLARFHHRLVSIHAFPNGNGRHARLATDLLAGTLGLDSPRWGSAELTGANNSRTRYLLALREADSTGRFDSLLSFMWG